METLYVSQDLLNTLYSNKKVKIPDSFEEPDENQYIVFKTPENSSALVVYKSPYFYPLTDTKPMQSIKPKDSNQKAFLHSLQDPTVLMAVALGKAGTGKTLLSIAYALEQYFKNGKAIVLIKPSAYVGGKSNVMGILPGDVNDKLSGVMASYLIHIRSLLGIKAESIIYDMIETNMLTYLPVELARGMSLENSTVIFDECQNTDFHTMKTIVSRVAASSKLICLGDLGQVDINLHKSQTGLFLFIDSHSYKDSPVTSIITLKSQYRSALADLTENISEEYYKEKHEV